MAGVMKIFGFDMTDKIVEKKIGVKNMKIPDIIIERQIQKYLDMFLCLLLFTKNL